MTSSGPAPTSPTTFLRNVSLWYTGREDIGLRLSEAFKADDEDKSRQTKVFVVQGMGGIGKSEVCLKYAEQHYAAYWGTFWINCSSQKTAEASFKLIAQQCHWPESDVLSVTSRLSSSNKRWLLILDNADDPDVSISDYIPRLGTGHVIITTRNLECLEHANVGSEQLGRLDLKAAMRLLLKASGREKLPGAVKLLQALGCLTLAIVLAGSFIRTRLRSATCFEDYLELFDTDRLSILRYEKKQGASEYRNIFRTFEVSAEFLQRQKDSGNVAAADAIGLMHCISFMDVTGDFETIFARATAFAQSILSDNKDDSLEDELRLDEINSTYVPDFAPDATNHAQGRVRWNDAYHLLLSLALVTDTSRSEDRSFSMHTLIRSWAQERQGPILRPRSWLVAANSLVLSLPNAYGYDEFLDSISSHVRQCMSCVKREYMECLPEMSRLKLVYWLLYVSSTTRDDSGFEIGTTLLRDDDCRLPGCAFRTDAVHVNIQRLCAANDVKKGQYNDAVKLLEHVVRVEEKLTDDHPSRLASQHALAGAYQANGQVEEAVKLLEHVVRVEEARPVLERVVSIQSYSLEQGHPRRTKAELDLVRLYLAMQLGETAVSLCEKVVQVEERRNWSYHTCEKTASILLVQAYMAADRQSEGIQLSQHVLKVQREHFSADHPTLLRTKLLLANTLVGEKAFEEGIAYYESVLSQSGDQAHTDELEVLSIRFNLAIAFLGYGRLTQGLQLLKQVEAAERRLLGPGHPSLLLTEQAINETEKVIRTAIKSETQSPHEDDDFEWQYITQVWKQETRTIIPWTRISDLRSTEFKRSRRPPSTIELFQLALERYSGKPWAWWPLSPPLEQCLLSWTQGSTKHAVTLSADLASSITGTPVRGMTTLEGNTIRSDLSRSEENDTRPASEIDRSEGDYSSMQDQAARSARLSASVPYSTSNSRQRDLHLLIAVEIGIDVRYQCLTFNQVSCKEHIRPSRLCDHAFTLEAKAAVQKLRGWRHWLSPWALTYFHCDRFEKSAPDKLHVAWSELPATENKDYDLDRAHGGNHAPISVAQWRSRLCAKYPVICQGPCPRALLSLLPKKRSPFQLGLHPQDKIEYYWGLHAIIGPAFAKVMAYQCLLLIAFFVYYVWRLCKVDRNDQQDAVAPLMLIIALESGLWLPLSTFFILNTCKRETI